MIQDGVPFETVFRQRSFQLRSAFVSLRTAFVFLFFVGFATAGLTANARADFRVCNGTKDLVGVAIGYRANAGWTTEGWWQIPATSCATLIKGQLSSRYYYLYAEDAARGGRWGGDIDMCVADNEFKIVGVKDCFARGFQKMGFKEYDTGRQGSWMVQLTGGSDAASPSNASAPNDKAGSSAGEQGHAN